MKLKKQYPKDYIGLVLFVGMSQHLSGEALKSFVADAFEHGRIRTQFIVKYMEKADIEIMKNNPDRPEDVYIYNYIQYRGRLRTKDLMKKYYDLYVDIDVVNRIIREVDL